MPPYNYEPFFGSNEVAINYSTLDYNDRGRVIDKRAFRQSIKAYLVQVKGKTPNEARIMSMRIRQTELEYAYDLYTSVPIADMRAVLDASGITALWEEQAEPTRIPLVSASNIPTMPTAIQASDLTYDIENLFIDDLPPHEPRMSAGSISVNDILSPTMYEIAREEISRQMAHDGTAPVTVSPQRRRNVSDMVMDIVRTDEFPKPNFEDWNVEREFELVRDDWYSNVDYRERWIFDRREREGFNRRNIELFSLDDMKGRLSKRRKSHPLDTEHSKFYDWKLGGTNWILRLELYTRETEDEQYKQFLICRHIHVPSNREMLYTVRYWDGEKFRKVKELWSDCTDNAGLIENFLRQPRHSTSSSWRNSFESDPFEPDMQDVEEYEEDYIEDDE